MPIHQLAARRTLPILGKIRLGVRKEAKSGNTYPSTVEHFVLDDAPGVEAVYGKDPVAIDIMFPVDDLEQIVPTNFKRYGAGVNDKEGNPIGGKLQCIGPGPTLEGGYGIARWRELNSDPPADEILEKDAKTGRAMTRKCFGSECRDYQAKKCKQMMQVFCILPKVSFFGVFQIDTSSWMSIHQFHNQLQWVQELNSGKVRLIPFRIFREEEVTRYQQDGKEKTGKQYIMKLGPNEQFLLEAGDEVKKKFEMFRGSASNLLLPPAQELEALPAEDHFPVIDADQAEEQRVVEQRLTTAEGIIADPEVAALLPEYEKAIGKQLTPKDRVILVRRKEMVPDPSDKSKHVLNPNWKADVLSALRNGIEAAGKKKQQQPPAPPTVAPPPQQAPAPDAEGIM